MEAVVFLLCLFSLSTAQAAPTATWAPDEADESFAGPVALDGDYNGDGDADLVITHYRGADSPALQSWVWYGNAAGLPAASPDFTTPGAGLYARLIGSAGDLDGDGDDELLITAEGLSTADILLFPGDPAGLSAATALSLSDGRSTSALLFTPGGHGDLDGDGYEDLVLIDTTDSAGPAVVVDGGGAAGVDGVWDQSLSHIGGASLAPAAATVAGDVDGDGLDDLLVGIPNEGCAAGALCGRAFLLSGGADGLDPSPALSITGPASEARLGAVLSGAGDINGDGYADFALGLPQFAGGVDVYAGEVDLYLGGPTLSAVPDQRLVGLSDNDYFGHALTPAGDTDGDGYDDLFISARRAAPAASGLYGPGCVGLYRGGPGGLDPVPVIERCAADDFGDYGYYIGAGDFNGDGIADLVVDSLLTSAVYAGSQGFVELFVSVVDADGDGTPASTDCDDADAAVGGPAEAFVDGDGDGHGDPSLPTTACDLTGLSLIGDDCDDGDPAAYPGAPEVAGDGVDQDCDGSDLSEATDDTAASSGEAGEGGEPADSSGGDKSGCATVNPEAALAPLGLVLLTLRGRRRPTCTP